MTKQLSILLCGALVLPVFLTACSSSTTTPPTPTAYVVTPIVADTLGYGATSIDKNLRNPWGIVAAPSAPFWVSNNHAGGVGEYNSSTGAPLLEIAIPDTIGTNTTGIVYNADQSAFVIPGSGASTYVVASEDGIIWGYSTTGLLFTKGATFTGTSSFKGLGIGAKAGSPVLYAANFKNGSVDLFDKNFARVGQFGDNLSGADAIPTGPTGFAPFNATVVNGTLYVTYAKQKGDGDDESGVGNGYVDIFNSDGTFQKRFASKGTLNSPWGMAIAPDGFGDQKGKLLVGNFGDGRINVYDPSNGNFIGQLRDASGNVIAIEGLWALYVNNGVLYYTAGPGDEEHGVLGKITVK